jgi:hypothetical protein
MDRSVFSPENLRKIEFIPVEYKEHKEAYMRDDLYVWFEGDELHGNHLSKEIKAGLYKELIDLGEDPEDHVTPLQ